MSAFTTYSAEAELKTAGRRTEFVAVLVLLSDITGRTDETPVSGDQLAVSAKATRRQRQRRGVRVRVAEMSEGCIG